MLHFIGVTVPGALLAILLLEPQIARAIVAGVVGFLPAIPFQVVGSDDGGVLTDVALSFHGIGTQVQAMGIELFQFTSGSILVLGAVVVAALSYRLAILRFERYTPPT